jgi:hypothetical protein
MRFTIGAILLATSLVSQTGIQYTSLKNESPGFASKANQILCKESFLDKELPGLRAIAAS